MAQTPQKDAEAGKTTPQSASSSKSEDAKTVSARVFTDFAAI